VTSEHLFLLMVLAAGLLSLGYFRGRKINLALARTISRELEGALQPRDQTYTWLGGVLGFRAEYTGSPRAPRVEATLALAPRHSLLYLPVARITTGGDRLYVVVHPVTTVKHEAHVIARSYRRRLGTLDGEERWRKETVASGGKEFEVLGSDARTVARLSEWLRGFPQATHLRHLAVVPSSNTLYLFLAPAVGQVQPAVDHALSWLTSQR
jgi:hypothetical protein